MSVDMTKNTKMKVGFAMIFIIIVSTVRMKLIRISMFSIFVVGRISMYASTIGMDNI